MNLFARPNRSESRVRLDDEWKREVIRRATGRPGMQVDIQEVMVEAVIAKVSDYQVLQAKTWPLDLLE
ncbi:hypothetical protein ACFX15_018152 [Malus domestica]